MIFNMTGGSFSGGLPKFSYSGDYQLIDDGRVNGKRNWKIRFLTSGTLTFDRLKTPIDVFLVGGGGANGNAKSITDKSGSGGSGFTFTRLKQILSEDTPYEIQIGEGGVMPSSNAESAVTQGGSSTAFGNEAEGGYSGWRHNGGDGGSGGADADGTIRATDGADGYNSSGGGSAGEGQGTTTREFGETTGELYATGGAQGSGNGAPNTGDGGGGTDEPAVGTAGGSGIVIIRNAR